MKITVKDKFLWDLYFCLEKTINIAGYVLNPTGARRIGLPGSGNEIARVYNNKRRRRQFSNMMYYLKTHNLIKVKSLDGNKAILLTKKGMNQAIIANFKMESKRLRKREDGKFIMIVFDIPQKYSKSRNLLRSILKNLGYEILQHSVWVTPFNVFEKTTELLQKYSLDKYVKIFLIEKP